MKNTDLRIGNIIQYNDGDICRVIGISEFGLDVEFKEETTYIEHEHFSGIPLTEEILLKCGFEKDESWGMLFIKKPYLIYHDKYLNKNILGVYLSGKPREYQTASKQFKYLHQLQNLYHALTCQELKIEL